MRQKRAWKLFLACFILLGTVGLMSPTVGYALETFYDFESQVELANVISENAQVMISDAYFSSGCHSAEILLGSEGGSVGFPVEVEAGKDYHVTVKLRCDTVESTNETIGLRFRSQNSVIDLSQIQITKVNIGKWVSQEGVLRVSDADIGYLEFYGNSQQTLYVDDIQVMPLQTRLAANTLIPGGNFDSESDIERFSLEGASSVIFSEDAYTGTGSAKVTFTGAWNRLQAEHIPAKTDTLYYASAYIKIAEDSPSSEDTFLFNWYVEGSGGNHLSIDNNFEGEKNIKKEDGWVRLSAYYKTVSTYNSYENFFAISPKEGAVTVLIDNFELYEITDLVIDGDCENSYHAPLRQGNAGEAGLSVAYAADGIYSYRMLATADGQSVQSDPIYLVGGQRYRVAFDILSDVNTTLDVNLFYDGSDHYKSVEIYDTGNFQSCEVIFDVIGDFTEQSQKFIEIIPELAGEYYIDNLSLIQIPPLNLESGLEDGSSHPIGEDIILTFTNPIAQESLTTECFTINGSGELISEIIQNGNIVRIVLKEEMMEEYERYTLTIHEATDIYGDSFSGEFEFFAAEKEEWILQKEMEDEEDLPDIISDGTTAEISTDCAAWGNSSLHVIGNSVFYQTAQVQPGALYDISYSIKFGAGNPPELPTVEFAMQYNGANGPSTQTYIGNSGYMTETSFQEVRFIYAMPEDLTVAQRVQFYFYVNQAPANYYVDHFSAKLIRPTDVVGGTLPANSAVEVERRPEITLKFNHPLKSETVSPGNISLNADNTLVQSAVLSAPDTLQLTLSRDLDCGTVYSLEFYNIYDTYNRPVVPNYQFRTVDQYHFDTFRMYREDGTPMPASGLTEGKVKAQLSGVTNNADEQGTVTLLLALYKDDLMIGISMDEYTIPAKTTREDALTTEIIVPDVGDGVYYSKAFIVEDLTNIQPLDNSIKVVE